MTSRDLTQAVSGVRDSKAGRKNDTSGCAGKIGYKTRAQADRVKQSLFAKPGMKSALHTYHCDKCGAFHLGRDIKAGRPDRIGRDHFIAKALRYAELIEQT